MATYLNEAISSFRRIKRLEDRLEQEHQALKTWLQGVTELEFPIYIHETQEMLERAAEGKKF